MLLAAAVAGRSCRQKGNWRSRLLQPSLAGDAEGKTSGIHQLVQPSLARDAGGEVSGACHLQQPLLAGTAGGEASGACHWLQPPLAVKGRWRGFGRMPLAAAVAVRRLVDRHCGRG